MKTKMKHIMSKQVQVVPPHCAVRDAALKMRSCDIGFLPVCSGDRILGVITDRDITTRVVAEGLSLDQTTVEVAMSSPFIYCYEDQELEEAVRIMEVKQVRRLAVIDRDQRLVGVASIGDIAVRTGRGELAGEVLERISEPTSTDQKNSTQEKQAS